MSLQSTPDLLRAAQLGCSLTREKMGKNKYICYNKESCIIVWGIICPNRDSTSYYFYWLKIMFTSISANAWPLFTCPPSSTRKLSNLPAEGDLSSDGSFSLSKIHVWLPTTTLYLSTSSLMYVVKLAASTDSRIPKQRITISLYFSSCLIVQSLFNL